MLPLGCNFFLVFLTSVKLQMQKRGCENVTGASTQIRVCGILSLLLDFKHYHYGNRDNLSTNRRKHSAPSNSVLGVFALFFCQRRNGGTEDTQDEVMAGGTAGAGGLAGGPQHLKPIRELWNIPQGSSTLAVGHCKGPNRECRCDSGADKQVAKRSVAAGLDYLSRGGKSIQIL